MTAKDVLEKWIDAFNKADTESIAELYSDDAVNHQVALEPVVGKEAIIQMFENEFSKVEMVCIPENIFQNIKQRIPLELMDTKTYSSGLQSLKYLFKKTGTS